MAKSKRSATETWDTPKHVESSTERDGSELIELILGAPSPAPPTSEGAVVGRLSALSPAPMVTFDERPEAIPARSTVALSEKDLGREALLVFERGDLSRPIITGLLEPVVRRRLVAEIDGKTAVLEGADAVVLRCGKASITLTRAGKVLIQGAYVSTRSTGMHRIKGGAVQIN